MSPEEIEAERLDEIAAGLLDAHIEDEELHEMEVSCPYNWPTSRRWRTAK